MKKLHLIDARSTIFIITSILLAFNAEASFLLLDKFGDGSGDERTRIYEIGFNVTTQSLTGSPSLITDIDLATDDITEDNSNYYWTSSTTSATLIFGGGSLLTGPLTVDAHVIGNYLGVEIHNGVRYMLGANNAVYQNSDIISSEQGSIIGWVNSGFVSLTYDGTDFYGIESDGKIYHTTLGATSSSVGVRTLIGQATAGGTIWDGIAYSPDAAPPPPVVNQAPLSSLPVLIAMFIGLFGSGLIVLSGVAKRK